MTDDLNNSQEENFTEFLTKRRQELNLEISEICKILNVKNSEIQALENQNWDFFQKSIYLNGFIYSYLKILKIDEKIINEKIRNLPIPSNVKNTKHKLVNIGENLDLTPDRNIFLNFLILSIILFLLFLGIYNFKEKNTKLFSTQNLIAKIDDDTNQQNQESKPNSNFSINQNNKNLLQLFEINKSLKNK